MKSPVPRGNVWHILSGRELYYRSNECYEKRNKIRTSTVGIDIDSIRELKVVQLLQRLFDKSFDVQAGSVWEWLSKRVGGCKENMRYHWSVPSVKSTLIHCVNATDIPGPTTPQLSCLIPIHRGRAINEIETSVKSFVSSCRDSRRKAINSLLAFSNFYFIRSILKYETILDDSKFV